MFREKNAKKNEIFVAFGLYISIIRPALASGVLVTKLVNESGSLAQLVEQWTFNPLVASSNLA